MSFCANCSINQSSRANLYAWFENITERANMSNKNEINRTFWGIVCTIESVQSVEFINQCWVASRRQLRGYCSVGSSAGKWEYCFMAYKLFKNVITKNSSTKLFEITAFQNLKNLKPITSKIRLKQTKKPATLVL